MPWQLLSSSCYTASGAQLDCDLDGLVAARRVGGQKLAGLLGEVQEDGAGLEQSDRFATRPIGIDDGGNLAVRVQGQEFRPPGLVFADVYEVRLVRNPDLLKHDGDLHAVRRGRGIELDTIGMLCRPAAGDREGREIGHGNSIIDMSRSGAML